MEQTLAPGEDYEFILHNSNIICGESALWAGNGPGDACSTHGEHHGQPGRWQPLALPIWVPPNLCSQSRNLLCEHRLRGGPILAEARFLPSADLY